MSSEIGGSSLDALLQRSEELTAQLHGGADLPRVKRNLNQGQAHHTITHNLV